MRARQVPAYSRRYKPRLKECQNYKEDMLQVEQKNRSGVIQSKPLYLQKKWAKAIHAENDDRYGTRKAGFISPGVSSSHKSNPRIYQKTVTMVDSASLARHEHHMELTRLSKKLTEKSLASEIILNQQKLRSAQRFNPSPNSKQAILVDKSELPVETTKQSSINFEEQVKKPVPRSSEKARRSLKINTQDSIDIKGGGMYTTTGTNFARKAFEHSTPK